MTVTLSRRNERPRKPQGSHAIPFLLAVWLALAMTAAGCKTNPDQTSTNRILKEGNRAAPSHAYASLPGTYEDREGKRTLDIRRSPSSDFRFVISAWANGEVFCDSVLNPGCRGPQSATNAITGVVEKIMIEEIQTSCVRIKRLDTLIPESVLFLKREEPALEKKSQ